MHPPRVLDALVDQIVLARVLVLRQTGPLVQTKQVHHVAERFLEVVSCCVGELSQILIGTEKSLFASLLSRDVRHGTDKADRPWRIANFCEECLAAGIGMPNYMVERPECPELRRKTTIAAWIERSPHAVGHAFAIVRVDGAREVAVVGGNGRCKTKRSLALRVPPACLSDGIVIPSAHLGRGYRDSQPLFALHERFFHSLSVG